MRLEELRIQDIDLERKSRHDIPALLRGIRYLCKDEKLRTCLFELIDKYIPPGINGKTGWPDIEVWRVFIMGCLKQGLGYKFSFVNEPVNNHYTIRKLLGHMNIRDEYECDYQTMVDNISSLKPELFAAVSILIVESGYSGRRKKVWRKLAWAV